MAGLPLGGVAGADFCHAHIGLLEGETLELGHEEVGEGQGEGAQGAPQEEDLGAEVGLIGADEVGGDDGNDGVPEPVGGGGHTDTAGSDGQREDLADNDPGDGAPGGGEEGDVDADEGNHGLDGRVVVGLNLSLSDTDGTDDELSDDHTAGTGK